MIFENGYITYQGTDCFMSCIQNYLRYYNCDIDETDIIYMGNGFNTKLTLLNKERNLEPIISTNSFKSVLNFLDICNVKYLKNKIESNEEAKQFLIECVNKNIPISIMVDAPSLNYNQIFQQSRSAHFINIIGKRQDKYFISDGFIPTFPSALYHSWLDEKVIYSGWNKVYNNYYILDIDSNNNIDASSIKNNFNVNLKNNLISYLNGGKTGENYSGIDALRMFNNYVPELIDIYKQNYKEKMIELNYKLKVFGLFTSRALLTKSLIRLNAEYRNNEFLELIEESEIVLKEWHKLSFLIVKAAFSKKVDTLKVIHSKINSLMNNEEELFKRIIEKL